MALIWIPLMTSDVEHLFIPFLAIHILCVSVQILCPFLNWIICLQKTVLKNSGVSEFSWMPSYAEEVTNRWISRIHFRKEQRWELMSLLSQVGCTVHRWCALPTISDVLIPVVGCQRRTCHLKMAASRERDGLHFYLFIYFCYRIRHEFLLS